MSTPDDTFKAAASVIELGREGDGLDPEKATVEPRGIQRKPSPFRRCCVRVHCCVAVLVGLIAVTLGILLGVYVLGRDKVESFICPAKAGPPICHAFLLKDSDLFKACLSACDSDDEAGQLCRLVDRTPGRLPCTHSVGLSPDTLMRKLGGVDLRDAAHTPSLLSGSARKFFDMLEDRGLINLLMTLLEDPQQLGNLWWITAPYLLTPSIGGQRAPDSIFAAVVRWVIKRPIVQKTLFSTKPVTEGAIAELLNLVNGIGKDVDLISRFSSYTDPDVFSPFGDVSLALKLTPTPDDFAAYVEKWYYGGAGIDLRRNDPAFPILSRLANYFQNSWMSHLLVYDQTEEIYYFSCNYTHLSELNEQGKAPPILLHIITPDEKEPDESSTYLRGGSRSGRLEFKMVNGTLTPLGREAQYKKGTLRPEWLQPLVHCAHNGAQTYHAALHVVSESMAYASQDLAVGRHDMSQDPVFRLLNPGGNQTSAINWAADSTLVEVNGLGSRGVNADDLKAWKKHVLAPLLTDPCNSSRHSPRGDAVPEDERMLFATTLQRAQQIVCDEKNRVILPDQAVADYTHRLAEPLGMDELVGSPLHELIEPHFPSISAQMVGIEHAMTFSINFLWAELERQDAAALLRPGATNPRAFGTAFFLDVVASAVITVFSKSTVAECKAPIDVPNHERGAFLGLSASPGPLKMLNLRVDWPEDLPFAEAGNKQTSVENEMLIVASMPRSQALGYAQPLRSMAVELTQLWAETSEFFASSAETRDYPVTNASFVFEQQRCVSSSTWI